jgi:hypothetical protein
MDYLTKCRRKVFGLAKGAEECLKMDDRQRERISGNHRIVFITRKLGNVRATPQVVAGATTQHIHILFFRSLTVWTLG